MKKIALSILFFYALVFTSNAQESKFKSLMIYQFTRLIGWPNADANSTFKIYVYGETKVYENLKTYTLNKNVGTRGIEIFLVKEISQITNPDIVYIGEFKAKDINAVAQHVGAQSSVLIITSAKNALDKGSIINFVTKDDLIQIEINKIVALKRSLQISKQVEKSAVFVKEQ